MLYLRNPRGAPPGNRTLWLATWMFELAALFGLLCLVTATFLVLKHVAAADITLIIGAVATVVGLFGGWALKIYTDKSISRGPGQPDGRGAQDGTP